jgi:xylose isomerase
MIEDGGLSKAVAARYAGWKSPEAQKMLESDLDTITERVLAENINPEPVSGRQEILENYVNRFV